MIIECPACQTRAKLPDSKEGAKVRCSECERVYVAHPVGVGGKVKRGDDPTKYFLIGGVVVLFGAVMFVLSRTPDTPPVVKAEEPEIEPTPFVDYSWNGPLLRMTRDLHLWVHGRDDAKLRMALDPERVHARLHPAGEGVLAYAELDQLAKSEFMEGVLASLIEAEGDTPVALWNPYDGWVEAELDGELHIRVKMAHRDPALGMADRHIEWRFVERKGRWKAYSWERWISPAEEEKARRTGRQKTTKRTLSDGSYVIESEIRPIPYDDDVTSEQRQEIEKLIAILIDLEVPGRELSAARTRLTEIGKPAIAGLLTKIAEIPLGTEEQAQQLGLVHFLLQDITGYVTTYKPHVALGATEERMESGLKQWFGWYDRKYKRFNGKDEGEDPFWDDPDIKPRNERERRDFEKARREREEGSGG